MQGRGVKGFDMKDFFFKDAGRFKNKGGSVITSSHCKTKGMLFGNSVFCLLQITMVQAP